MRHILSHLPYPDPNPDIQLEPDPLIVQPAHVSLQARGQTTESQQGN